MYGKSFESKFTGSLVGAGFAVFAVWDYAITNAQYGAVELNPRLVAFTLAGARVGAEKEVVEAIEYLCRADQNSRSKAEDGRRMVKEGQFQYRIVNWAMYQGIKTEEARKEYNRRKQAEYRASKRSRPANGELAHENNVNKLGVKEAERILNIAEKLKEGER